MESKVDLWIDHEQAIIETLTPVGQTTLTLKSRVEKQPGRFNGVRSIVPFEALQVVADDSQQRRYTGRLNRFYDAAITSIGDAAEIFIFGPSEAKGELNFRLVKNGLGNRIVYEESMGKMTPRQIAAKVKNAFSGKKP